MSAAKTPEPKAAAPDDTEPTSLPAPAPADLDVAASADGLPLSRRIDNPHWRSTGGNLRGGILREIKMMAPRCNICQSGASIAIDWYASCTHGPYGDPYYSWSAMSEERFATTVVDGKLRANPTDSERWYEPVPNLVQIALSRRVGNSTGDITLIDRKRKRGYILPEEHPTRPLDSFCQYRDCYNQEVVRYQNGEYCREIEAKLIRLCEEDGTAIEVFSDRIRRKQLGEVTVR